MEMENRQSQLSLEHEQFRLDVLLGLSAMPKSLPSRYIYDDEGSRLFDAIMEVPEYYPTRCEDEILRRYPSEFSKLLAGTAFNLVELGAGNGVKVRHLLEHFTQVGQDFSYVPIDISKGAIEQLEANLKDLVHQGLDIKPVVAEYFEGLQYIRDYTNRRNFVLFLGGNIGNMDNAARHLFMRTLWNTMNDGDLVCVGFDLKKEITVLNKAYNDKQGVTEAFNKNLLRRMNRELGATFDENAFSFYSTYNPFSGAVESFLISMKMQEVYIEALQRTFNFSEWEPIHTEFSFKFTDEEISRLAVATGFSMAMNLKDRKGYFCDSIWRCIKQDATDRYSMVG